MQKADAVHEVDIATLRLAVNLIFDRIETRLLVKKTFVRNDKDYYWEINIDDIFKTKHVSPDITIGRVRDDYEFIADMVGRAIDGYDAPSLMLMHVTPLLNHLRESLRSDATPKPSDS